ncbi:MAG: hypothetical protein ACE5I1_18670 [bacterium]
METNSLPETENIDYNAIADELERSLYTRKGFFRGIIIGVILTIFTLGMITAGLYINKNRVVTWTVKNFAVSYMKDFFAAFPDAYMTHNQERVLLTFDNFTNAVAANMVDHQQLQQVAGLMFNAMDDKKITYQEMGKILDAVDLAAEKWTKERKK